MRRDPKSTYSFEELVSMMLVMDKDGLIDLWQLIIEEMQYYCLVDLESLKKIKSYRWNELKSQV